MMRGAAEETRTLNTLLGRQALYQLSYYCTRVALFTLPGQMVKKYACYATSIPGILYRHCFVEKLPTFSTRTIGTRYTPGIGGHVRS